MPKRQYTKSNTVNKTTGHNSNNPKHANLKAPWEKGKSMNPGGRPKSDPEFKALVKEYSVNAFYQILHLAQTSEDDRIRLQAAMYIVDRAHGKPMQSNEISGPNGTPFLPPVQFVVEPVRTVFRDRDTVIDGSLAD